MHLCSSPKLAVSSIWLEPISGCCVCVCVCVCVFVWLRIGCARFVLVSCLMAYCGMSKLLLTHFAPILAMTVE